MRSVTSWHRTALGAALTLIAAAATAQSTYWARSYHHLWADLRGSSAHLAADGGFVIAGGLDRSLLHQLGDRMYLPGQYLVIRTDSDGDPKWQVAWPDPPFWLAVAVDAVEVEAGGLIAAGFRIINGKGAWTTPVVRLDARGSVVWQLELRHPEVSYSAAAMTRTEEGVLIVGTTWSHAAWTLSASDVFAAEVRASDGSVRWLRRYDLGQRETATAVTRSREGGFVVAGNLEKGGKALGTFALVIGAEGKVQRVRSFGFPAGTASFGDVTPLSDGTYAFAGSFSSTGSTPMFPESSVLVVNAPLEGPVHTQWASIYRVFGNPDWSYGEAVAQTADGDLAVVGSSTIGTVWVAGLGGFGGPSFSPFYLKNAVLLKLRRDGARRWLRTYGGSGSDAFESVEAVEVASGQPAILVSGTTESFPPFATPPAVAGERIWVMNLDLDGMAQQDLSCLLHEADSSTGPVPVTDLNLAAKEVEAAYTLEALKYLAEKVRARTTWPCP